MDENEIINGYTTNPASFFRNLPKVSGSVLKNAARILDDIKGKLYAAPAFINTIQAAVPIEALRPVLTADQQRKLAQGTIELMTNKNGNILAHLINPETKRIIATVPLKEMKLSPDIMQALSGFAMQMQLAEISQNIHKIQIAVEEVRQGQKNDRLATAYSCQQKLLQAMAMSNPQIKAAALLKIAQDSEDSRNLLMMSQKENIEYIQKEPEGFIGKLFSGADSSEINKRMEELRTDLCCINMVSLTQALAYQELGEEGAVSQSLQYYSDYLENAYLSKKGLVERLDMIDASPLQYWSKTLPEIRSNIRMLALDSEKLFLGEDAK